MIARRAVLALAVFAAACGGEAPGAAPSPGPSQPAPAARGPAPVTGGLEAASDQTGDGSSLAIARVTIAGGDGYVVIHADNGGPGDVVGFTRVAEGETKDLAVALDPPAPPGTYWAMLHRDAGEVGRFEWPGGPDGPVRAAGLSYVTRKVVLGRAAG